FAGPCREVSFPRARDRNPRAELRRVPGSVQKPAPWSGVSEPLSSEPSRGVVAEGAPRLIVAPGTHLQRFPLRVWTGAARRGYPAARPGLESAETGGTRDMTKVSAGVLVGI